MKYLLTICFLIANTFVVNAQKPNFDETVKHINYFLEENRIFFWDKNMSRGEAINMMRAKKNGTIIFLWKNTKDGSEKSQGSFNLRDVKSYKNSYGYLSIVYSASSNSLGGLTDESAARLEKMLRHLTTLCTEKDPFD